ncbi:transporter substrate-binding domain-containing protein, partial [Salmonella enterica subsp. enterica serovar Montevideo]|nr:transporter substrate-binding domain-containing protein [Salmonella enterica subsp. enterica serovar Montevideo]
LPGGERANLRIITQNRLALNQITAVLPDESKVIMSSLRQFSGIELRVGVPGDYAPLAFHNRQNKLIGFDIDMAYSLGKALHLNIL